MKRSADMILTDPVWATLEKGKADYDSIPFFCLKRCGKAKEIFRPRRHENGEDDILRDDLLFHFTPDEKDVYHGDPKIKPNDQPQAPQYPLH